jgi:hypothetical protein
VIRHPSVYIRDKVQIDQATIASNRLGIQHDPRRAKGFSNNKAVLEG